MPVPNVRLTGHEGTISTQGGSLTHTSTVSANGNYKFVFTKGQLATFGKQSSVKLTVSGGIYGSGVQIAAFTPSSQMSRVYESISIGLVTSTSYTFTLTEAAIDPQDTRNNTVTVLAANLVQTL